MTTYDEQREALRQAELELMLQRERVARLRRELPPGPLVTDYRFRRHGGSVRLSELFTGPDRALILYHFMFGKAQAHACPMCSMWAQGWNGVAGYIGERVDFALVTAASVADNDALVGARGWDRLEFLSAADSSFKADIGGEDAAGNQWPFLSVYELTGEGPRLSYSGGAHITGDHWRGVDLLSPVWHLFDLTRAGRGDWMPS